jgi:hypothetical protein
MPDSPAALHALVQQSSREDMPTHPRKHSDDALIVAEILKDTAKPRQAVSVKKAIEKETRPLSPRKRWVGTRKKSTSSPAMRDSFILLVPIILAFIGVLWFFNGPSAHSELENLLVLFRH